MPDLRITAGTLRGRRIPLPPNVRPTSERARQAFFNIVAERVGGAHFLDLFAGSGVFSFEAVSRGAAAATAIEQRRTNARAIEKLARTWSAPVTVIPGDVLRELPRIEDPFDIIYADPPYDYDHYPQLLSLLAGRASAQTVVAVEHRKRTDPFAAIPAPLQRIRTAEYGEVWITFFGRV